MKLFRRPQCPYCGDRLNYAKAWVLKTRGEYICPKCGGLCNVRQDGVSYRLAFLAIILGAAAFIVGLVGRTNFAVITIPSILLVFLIFFLIAPLLVRLKRPAPPRQQQPNAARRPGV